MALTSKTLTEQIEYALDEQARKVEDLTRQLDEANEEYDRLLHMFDAATNAQSPGRE